MSGIQIIGMGHAVPSVCVTNTDLKKVMETSEEWIRTRTGIRERRFCGEGESLVTLAVRASEEAIASSGVRKEKICLVITATVTPDYQVPSTSCLVQEKLGLPSGIPAFDLNAACSGFVYGLSLVQALLPENGFALLIGAEQLSRMLDFSDRSTAVLFGDGAAAAVLQKKAGVVFYSHLAADGNRNALWAASAPANRLPAWKNAAPQEEEETAGGEPEDTGKYKIHMDGRAVFRFAVRALSEELRELEKQSGIPAEEIDQIVCHQANQRILDYVRKERGLPEEKFYRNLDRYGNTSGASIRWRSMIFGAQETWNREPGFSVSGSARVLPGPEPV
jgi:3-oxoacyl-[acyl-carrier-protein] synthase-3